jgi:hypothetical protein
MVAALPFPVMNGGSTSDPPMTAAGDDQWEIVDDGDLARDLRAELHREAGPGHLLHRADARAVARCPGCGQVAFHLGGGRFTVVELTGSGREEPPPSPPFTQMPSLDALRETMARHRHRHR